MTAAPRPPISTEIPDWSREAPHGFWDPSRRLLRALRRYQAARRRGGILGGIARRRWALSHRFWTVITQAELPLVAEIGGGLVMPHPNGIVVHSQSRLGPNCLLMQQVTLGVSRDGRAPTLGGHVDISAGARIIGGVHVGDHALVGANAVVTRDVPAYAVVAGVPARIIGDRRGHPSVAGVPAGPGGP